MVRMNCAMGGSLDMHTMIHCSLIIFFLGGLATTISYYNQEAADRNDLKVSLAATTPYANTSTKVFDHLKQMKIAAAPPTRTCDLFSGRWVHGNKSRYPLYKEDECPYLEDSFACQTYGRKDTMYLQWRWQPHDCDFPRFDSKAVVERLKGKRLLFVGDSLNRNQYNSMICMLHSSIQGDKKVGGDGGNLQSVGSSLDGPDQVYVELDNLSAYKMGLKAWSKWALTQVDRSKTKLFFMGATATHSRAKDWRGNNHANCYGETEPVKEGGLTRVSEIDSKMLSILESSLNKLKAKGVNVHLINVTQLTQYRKDGHTTVYRKYWRPLTELQKKLPERAADCSHWCLPGVPDTWNELLLAFIFQ